MNRIGSIFFLLLIVSAWGCGGSGSGGDFSGTWEGPLLLFEKSPDTCTFEETLSYEYVVEQSGNDIVVAINGQLILTGELSSKNSFEVGLSVGSALSPASFYLTFHSLGSGRAAATYTSFQGRFSEETGLVSCTGKWQGEVTKG